ncbi:MAG: hypothetical protein K8S94_02100 [Planctomycetia bacterium]|nr:hypothetical protein [Planctomycetia bacterium]
MSVLCRVATIMTITSVSCLALPGCAPATTKAPAAKPAAASHDHGHDHDHDHDEPESFADGVEKLESLAEDLAKKLADNAGEAADDAVHDLGHLLEEVREFATKEKFAADVAVTVTGALDELEECFGKVDEAFHSAEEKADPAKALESVKERIEAAFKALKVKATGEDK